MVVSSEVTRYALLLSNLMTIGDLDFMRFACLQAELMTRSRRISHEVSLILLITRDTDTKKRHEVFLISMKPRVCEFESPVECKRLTIKSQ